jgi:UPF0755 protein
MTEYNDRHSSNEELSPDTLASDDTTAAHHPTTRRFRRATSAGYADDASQDSLSDSTSSSWASDSSSQTVVNQFDKIIAGSRHESHQKIAVVAAAVVVVVVLIVGITQLASFFGGLNNGIEPGTRISVSIPEGSSAVEIAKLLKTAHVIEDENAFKEALARRNAESSLKSGIYTLTVAMNTDELITRLVTGPDVIDGSKKLTIPEGCTLQETAAKVEASCGIPAAEFMDCAYAADRYLEEYPFLEGAYNNSLEGFLYPKTYSVPQDASADAVVRILLNQFVIETAELDMSYATEHGLTLYDVVTLASLIEKETADEDERPAISSVIYNRLRAGMRLQIDATVVYALGASYDGHALLYDDLEVDSPYNTYLVPQLPAGPICSPQLASIIAAAHPDDTEYYYYVLASEEGTHTFCVSEDEFLEAKEAYQELFGIQ